MQGAGAGRAARSRSPRAHEHDQQHRDGPEGRYRGPRPRIVGPVPHGREPASTRADGERRQEHEQPHAATEAHEDESMMPKEPTRKEPEELEKDEGGEE